MSQGNGAIGTLINNTQYMNTTYKSPNSTIRLNLSVSSTPTATLTSKFDRFSPYVYSLTPTPSVTTTPSPSSSVSQSSSVSPSPSSSSSPSITSTASMTGSSSPSTTQSFNLTTYPTNNSFSNSSFTNVSSIVSSTALPTTTPIILSDVSMTITPYMTQGISPSFNNLQNNHQPSSVQSPSIMASQLSIILGSIIGVSFVAVIVVGSIIYRRRNIKHTPVFSSSKIINESVITKNPINYISSSILPMNYTMRNSINTDPIRLKITI